MAQKSGFFNAQMVAGLPDRQYNANDYCDPLAIVISNGVLRSENDDLKVMASGLALTVSEGFAMISGHYYKNTAPYALQTVTPPVSGSRIDRVVLRLDTSISARSIVLAYKTGTAAVDPTAPALTRSGNVYELGIADILVNAGASGVTVTDTRSDASLCGWLYSVVGDGSFFTSLDNQFTTWFTDVKDTLASVTLFKRYADEITLNSSSATVTFSIPQWDADVCFLDVYVNGMNTTDYTVSGSTLTFPAALDAGTEVTVFCYKPIDGTDIESVSDESTALKTQMAALNGVSMFTYKCTGSDDNVTISNIVNAIYSHGYVAAGVTEAADAFLTALGGNTWLNALPSNAHVTIHVCGTPGISTAAGTGTDGSYLFYVPHASFADDTRVTIDFADADVLAFTGAASTNYVVFAGDVWDVRNARISVSASSSGNVTVFSTALGYVKTVNAENCIFDVHAGAAACIGKHGTFVNCEGTVISEGGNAVCFAPDSANLVTVIGGKYKAYTKASGTISAVLYTAVGETDAVIIGNMINCPTVIKSGYTQSYSAVGNAGTIRVNTIVSPLSPTGSAAHIEYTIPDSKA